MKAKKGIKKLNNSRILLPMKIVSRVLLFAFGAFLLADDILWENLGRVSTITGMTPSVGVVETYEIASVHIHHGYIGAFFMGLSFISLAMIYVEEIEGNK